MKKEVLVIGGTGLLGVPVACRLNADGFRVRLLVRSPDKARALFDESYEIIPGDVTDVGSIRLALEGCSGVFINLSGEVEHLGVENTAETAAELGVDRLIYMSEASVCEENAWFPSTRNKLQAEKAIRSSGVPFTVFRPTWFMDCLPMFFRGDRAFLFGRDHPSLHWVAAEDCARMVSSAFDNEGAAGKKLWIYGPEKLTIVRALEKYCAAFHPGFKKVSQRAYLWGGLMAAARRDTRIKRVIRILKFIDRVGEVGDPAEADALLGKPQTTLDGWLKIRKNP